jgi:hypothetical protein
MTTTTNRRRNKKEEIVSRAIQILTSYLTETNGFQKIKEIVCNNNSNNSAEKSRKIFHIMFSPESIDALIQNMKLTGTAKSGIGILKASKSVSSFFSFSRKTTTRRKTTTNMTRLNDPIVSQVDVYLKPESLPIIERALEPLMKSCLSANFVIIVQSQCIEPIIKRVANGADFENYFTGGGRFPKVTRRCRTRTRRRS